MHTVHLSNKRSFPAAPGVSILESARQAGLLLEHSCKTGRCGTCKARRISGQSGAVGTDSVLTAAERLQGWLLTCDAIPMSELWLDIADIGAADRATAKTVPAKVDALRLLSPDVIEVRLRLPPSADFGFHPGQYVNVIGPGGIRRSYSIANAWSPSDRSIVLNIRRVVAGAMSKYWFQDAKVNDLLRFEGPHGTFFLRDTGGLDLVFLATGTGIAPIRSMLDSFAQEHTQAQPNSCLVLWGGRCPDDMYWNPGEMVQPSLALQFVPVLSRASDTWPGERGYVQDVFVRSFLPGRSMDRAAVYACGSPEMINAAWETLATHGLPKSQFHGDAFVASD